MFYNVENLYDTINDPAVDDEEFLPQGDNKWTALRYLKKLDDLARVISADGVPQLLGLCEIENRGVVEDLVARAPLVGAKMQVIHFNSPDKRGVDVALAYDPKVLRPLASQALRVEMPQGERPTRDILYAVMKTRTDTFHFFVNHWPSRLGGAASVPKRAIAAQTLKHKTDSIMRVNPAANIVIMGDFNDEPSDSSLAGVLEAGCSSIRLINAMCELQKSGQGSIEYKGNWQSFDQIIVSGPLVNRTHGWKLKSGSTFVVKHPWMLFTNDKGQVSPNRTFGGKGKYYGGYSDHLPVRATLIRQ